MKNTFVKVLSFMMALTMIVGAFGAITVSAAECAHEDRTEIAVVAPTCDTIGFTKYTCNDCGEEFADNVKAATGKHDYKDVPKTGATCDEPAYKAYKACSVCGKEDPNNRKTVDTSVNGGNSLGHLWTKTFVQVATCTVDGFTAPQCARCDKVDETKKSNITTAEHDYIYTVVTAPTACTAGSVQVTCSACDYNEVIAQDEAKHTEATMPATSSDKNVPLAGTGCQYKYASGKYCSVCYVVLSSTPNTTNTHGAKKLSEVTEMPEYAGGEITNANLTAELANLGLAIGDKLEVAAKSCTEHGYVIMYCAACKLVYKAPLYTNGGKSHELAKVGSVYPTDDNAHHDVDKKQDWKCKHCDYTETTVAKKATAHDYTGKYKIGTTEYDCVKTELATCEANGYTRHTCKLCLKYYDDAVTYKTGHNYGAPVYKSGTCGASVVYVQKCPNKGCEKPEKTEGVTLPEGATACKWAKVERKATCIADAYYEYECSVCKATKAYDKTDKPAAGKDPANHVYTAKTVSGITPIDNVSKLSCTTDQVDKYLCECKEVVTITTATKTGHTEAGKADPKITCDLNGDGDTEDAGENLKAVTATCKTKGVSAGEFCKNAGCTHVIKEPVVGKLDPNNHEDKTPTPIDSGNATCVAKEYTTKYYTCCGIKHTIETGEIDKTFAGHKLVTVAAKAATCTEKGYEEHLKCEYCKTLFKKGATALTDKIDAPVATKTPGDDGQHKWAANPTAKTEEKCDATGKYSYYDCDDCDAIKLAHNNQVVVDDPATTDKDEIALAKVIPAHGTKYMGRYAYLNSENGPTCTEGAWANITNDYICKKCVLEADKATAEANKADGIYWELPLNHKNSTPDPINATGSAKYDCTKPTYVVNYCDDCDYVWVSAYTPATNAKHDFDRNDDEKVDDKDYVASLCKPADCTNAGVNVFQCENANCKVTEEVAGAAATGHFLNTAGGKVAISFSCKDDAYVEYIGVACSGCGESVHYETIDGEKVLVGVVHKHVTSIKEATCTEDGFEIEYCSDCNEIFASTTEEKLGHEYNPGAPIEIVDGVAKYSCPVCGEYWTEEILEVVVDAEFSSTLLTAGATFTVDIFVTADNFTFNYFEIDCYDDDDACKLVKVELTDALPATAHADFAEDGWFWIYSEHDVNGDPAFITLDGEKVKVATLTYEVSDIAYGPATFEVGPYAAVVGFDEEGNAIEANFVNTYTYVDVVVAMAGDLNGDGGIGYSDVQAVMFAVANGANDLVADVNRDGAVDVFDIAALRKFTSSDNTAYDFFVMTGVDVEAVAAKYKADMNEDGYINDSDKVLFVEFIVDLLQDEYYLDFIVEMAYDDFADLDEFCADKAIDIAINGVPTI